MVVKGFAAFGLFFGIEAVGDGLVYHNNLTVSPGMILAYISISARLIECDVTILRRTNRASRPRAILGHHGVSHCSVVNPRHSRSCLHSRSHWIELIFVDVVAISTFRQDALVERCRFDFFLIGDWSAESSAIMRGHSGSPVYRV